MGRRRNVPAWAGGAAGHVPDLGGQRPAWIALSRAGYDVYRDFVNTPAFFALLPEIAGRFGLDVGCGEGHNTRLLAEAGAEIVALNTSRQFIDAAAAEHGRAFRFVLADGAVLPFADADLRLRHRLHEPDGCRRSGGDAPRSRTGVEADGVRGVLDPAPDDEHPCTAMGLRRRWRVGGDRDRRVLLRGCRHRDVDLRCRAGFDQARAPSVHDHLRAADRRGMVRCLCGRGVW